MNSSTEWYGAQPWIPPGPQHIGHRPILASSETPMSTSIPVTPQRPRVTPTVAAPRRSVASQLLKKTGLIRGSGEDVSMRDSTASKSQHRSLRSRATAQSKALEAVKGKAAANAMQKASTSNARAETPPDSRLPIRSRIPKKVTTNAEASVVQTWKVVLQKRYNAQAQFLNLDNLMTDPDLKKSGIIFNKGRESKEMHVIMKIASQFEPPVVTISLANNGLDGSHCFAALNRYLPNIVNVALTGNKVRSYKDMEIFGGSKWILKKLRELILLDNPLREVAVADGKVEEYRNEILRKFPSLEILDNLPAPHIRLGVAPTAPHVPLVPVAAPAFSVPIGPNVISEDIQLFAFTFLERFLAAFDANRPSLHTVYTPLSTFSFSYDSTIPPQSRQRGFLYKLPNQKKLDWKAWHSAGSRNLMKTHNSLQDARDKLYTGAADIMVGLSLLPPTKHVVAEGEKFVVDACQVDIGAGPQLFINVHGEFVEEPGVIDGIRSFDRTLILAPSPEGSLAKQSGWDAFILSDQLNVRQYSSHDSWTVGPMLTQAQEAEALIAGSKANPAHSTQQTNVIPGVSTLITPIPGSAQQSASENLHPLLNDLADSQRVAMLQLQALTGLNFQWTMMCLEANGWDLALAKSNYDELISSVPPMIPPEAYIQT